LLDDAVAAFLDSVTERAFDEPLLAIARAQGFTDVHLVHGQREFGKDVIARRDGEQWAWQSKAGDINQTDWRDLTGQLDELRVVNLGHGSFDPNLPRHPVLVTTGRLTGNAPDLYRDYNERARERGEPELDLWDRDTLVGLLSGNPDAILRGSMDGQLLAVLGSVDEETVTMASIEVFSRRWTAWEPQRLAGLGVIEAGLLCERLKQAGRLDLACHVALSLLRGAWAASAGDAVSSVAADAAGQLFDAYARYLWDECDERLLREKGLVGYSSFSAWVTYPVRCVRLAEMVALLSLRVRETDPDLSTEIADWLTHFANAQPGVAHPISDQYAVSLIPATLVIALLDETAARALLQHATVWLCDAYERGQLGLAGVDAGPIEEIERLIGSPFEVVDRPRRRGSLIATVLLDLCSTLGMTDIYADVYNDIEAVRIYPWVLRLADGPDQYLKTGLANRLDPHVDFAEELDDNEEAAPHHRDVAGRQLCEQGRAWDLLAVSAALRDRHFLGAIRSLASHRHAVRSDLDEDAERVGDEPGPKPA
jgi:hypothetical protein